MNECEHKWVFMETAKQVGYIGSYSTPSKEWRRIDRFYCEKCLEIKEIKKTVPGRCEKPEWFD